MTRPFNSWNAADRRKAVYQPVFASYIFVKATDDLLRLVKKIDGVINIIYWRDKPAVIREIEIEMMRRFLQEHESVNLEKTSVNTSEIVKIINSTVNNGGDPATPVQKVKLVLPSLGFMMEAVVETELEIRLQPDTRPLRTSLAKFG